MAVVFRMPFRHNVFDTNVFVYNNVDAAGAICVEWAGRQGALSERRERSRVGCISCTAIKSLRKELKGEKLCKPYQKSLLAPYLYWRQNPFFEIAC